MATITLNPAESIELAPPDGLYEMVAGQYVEKLMGVREAIVMNHLSHAMDRFVHDRQMGRVESEMLFDLGRVDGNQRRPDIAFVSEEKWPKKRIIPAKNAWAVVPDLVVEVVSPSNSANEVERKVMEYLQAGVRLVWVVHPTTSRVYVHDGSAVVRVISIEGSLEGGEVLAGFLIPLAELFDFGTDDE